MQLFFRIAMYLDCRRGAMKLLSLVSRLPEWLSSKALMDGPGRKCDSCAQRGSSSIDLVAMIMALLRSPSW